MDLKSRFASLDELSRKWKDVGLRAQLNGPIEADAVRTAAERDSLKAGRSQLIQLTKEFNKIDQPEEKLAKLGPLVKAFQLHVDESSKCIRGSEVARSAIFELLKQLEDPVPALERFLRSRAEIEESMSLVESAKKLREKCHDLEEEMSELKNQEVTIASLREQLAEAEFNAVQEKQQAASEMNAEVSEVLRSWQERESNLRQENAALTQESRKFQRMYNEVSLQFSGVKQQLEHLIEQRELDAERHMEQSQELEVQLAVARREAKSLQDSVSSLQEQLAAAEEERRESIHSSGEKKNQLAVPSAWSSSPRKQRGGSGGTTTSTTAEGGEVESAQEGFIGELHERIASLEEEKNSAAREFQSTIDALRRQVSEMEAWAKNAREQYEDVRGQLDDKKSECASLRRKLDDAADEARDLRKQVLELESTLSAQQQQILQQQQQQMSADGSTSIIDIPTVSQAGAAQMSSRNNSRPSTPVTSAESAGATNSSGGNRTTLEAVAAQRDSLKRRLMHLEDASQREVGALKQELAAVKVERAALLSEVSKANGGGGANSGSASSGGGGGQQQQQQGGGGLPNPAMMLSKTQNQTNVLDAAGNLIAKFVSLNATTRRIFVIYLLSLHAMFFLWLSIH